jgi:hypothetical protein
MGNAYRLEVDPSVQSRPVLFEAVNFGEGTGASHGAPAGFSHAGSVYFTPMDSAPVIRDAVWIFSELGFTLSSQGRILWTHCQERASGFFVYRAGCFWVANALLGESNVKIDDSSLASGQIAPLSGGCLFEIGSITFNVTIA